MIIEIPVYCLQKWQSKPYLDYFIEINKWVMFINSKRDYKRIKLLIKVAKKRVQREVQYDIGIVPTIKFKIEKYREEKR